MSLLNVIDEHFNVSITDIRGNIVEVNDAFCSLTQYAEAELIGQNHRIVKSGYHEPVYFEQMWRTIKAGHTWRGEICNKAKDGSLYWVDCIVSPLFDDEGKIEQFISIRSDITEKKLQAQELDKSHKLLNSTGKVAGVGGWELDLTTMSIYWSQETRNIHGVDDSYQPNLAEAINFYAPEAQPVISKAVEHAIATGEGWDVEVPFIRANGERIWIRAVGSAEFENGNAVKLIGAFQDITSIRNVRTELAKQHGLLQVTLDSIGDAVITTDAKGNIQWLNPVAQQLTGWSKEEAVGKPSDEVFNIVNEETRLVAEDPIKACLLKKETVSLVKNTVLISRVGKEYGIEDSASPIKQGDGEILGVVLVFYDVTEQRKLTNQITYQAKHDALTGLVNRSEFEVRLARLLTGMNYSESKHVVLFIDLDQFKIINDTCGHAAGDKVLVEVSEMFGELIRGRDTLARLGGDEFGVILEYCSERQALRVAQAICDKMEEKRFQCGSYRFRVGASIGLVEIDKHWPSTTALMQAADMACYEAKDAGRNRVYLYSSFDQSIRIRDGAMQWATQIEKALDEDQFVLYFQKIVDVNTQAKGLNLEVLLRMKNGRGEIVAPGLFLPAAERFHLACRIDKWVLNKTISWINNLSEERSKAISMISINLSGQSICDNSFHEYVAQQLVVLAKAVRSKISIEITETAAITNMTNASLFIKQAKALGLSVALDDFGSGASFFGYLKELDVDLLKIDGQFIQNLLTDPLDEVAVSSFIKVANVVGLKSIAEFVDKPALLEKVKSLGIDFVQGYLIHQPQPLSELFIELQ